MDRAMNRVEAALARIERAANRTSGGDGDLAKRHEALRGRVTAVLGEIDLLVESLER